MNNYGKALKMERLELSEGLEHFQGELVTKDISIHMGNFFTTQNSHKMKKGWCQLKMFLMFKVIGVQT
jgi:hypothetical protein